MLIHEIVHTIQQRFIFYAFLALVSCDQTPNMQGVNSGRVTGRFQLVTTSDGNLIKIYKPTGQVWKTTSSSPSSDFMPLYVNK